MIRRKATIGVSLVCSLLVCAFIAQSALGAAATNTTWVTCQKGALVKDFSEEHCDTKVKSGGTFGHVSLNTGETREVFGSNLQTKNNTTESTPAIFKGTIFGVKLEITCIEAAASGIVVNEEPVAKQHTVSGAFSTEFGTCTVNKPAIGCKVKQPLKTVLGISGAEGLGAKNEMGLEFKPNAGEPFLEFTLEGCFIAGKFKVTGSAISTGAPAPTDLHSGATTIFTNAMTKETLQLAGSPAEISSTVTFETKSSILPIAVTTAT